MKIHNEISSRELNHNSSAVLREVRAGTAYPITYGREGRVVAYLIPASTLSDPDEIDQLRQQLTSRQPTARDVVMASTVGRDSSLALTHLREGERY